MHQCVIGWNQTTTHRNTKFYLLPQVNKVFIIVTKSFLLFLQKVLEKVLEKKALEKVLEKFLEKSLHKFVMTSVNFMDPQCKSFGMSRTNDFESDLEH